MNHPTNEQWMSFCYNEVGPEERARLAEHLQACPHCSAAMNAWQQTKNDLNTWRLPKVRTRVRMQPLLIKWAAAALLLFTSFCLGRLSFTAHPTRDSLDQMRHEITAMVQQQLGNAADSIAAASEERTKQQLASALDDLRAEQLKSRRALSAALQKMEAQRAADYVSLRKDLDTLAVNADAQLRTTERHLLQVATLAKPINASATP